MNILRDVYNKILSSQCGAPPETGGILGGTGGIVSAVEFDDGIHTNIKCRYSPNVKVLNEAIKAWQRGGIIFMGIFHTHFGGAETLSQADKYYIEKIVRNMPSLIEELYFPLIVMPQKEMTVYKAYLTNKRLAVEAEDILIV